MVLVTRSLVYECADSDKFVATTGVQVHSMLHEYVGPWYILYGEAGRNDFSSSHLM